MTERQNRMTLWLGSPRLLQLQHCFQVALGGLHVRRELDRFAVLGDGVIELPLAKEVVPAVVVVERG